MFFRTKSPNEHFDTDMMAKEFLMNFTNHVLSVSQALLFTLPEKPLMTIKIKSIEGKELNTLENELSSDLGIGCWVVIDK